MRRDLIGAGGLTPPVGEAVFKTLLSAPSGDSTDCPPGTSVISGGSNPAEREVGHLAQGESSADSARSLELRLSEGLDESRAVAVAHLDLKRGPDAARRFGQA